jgi:putative transposase
MTLEVPREVKRTWIGPSHKGLSVGGQCALAELSRSSYYHESSGNESQKNLALMRVIDELYMERPFYGAPLMTLWLVQLGHRVNHKRVVHHPPTAVHTSKLCYFPHERLLLV